MAPYRFSIPPSERGISFYDAAWQREFVEQSVRVRDLERNLLVEHAHSLAIESLMYYCSDVPYASQERLITLFFDYLSLSEETHHVVHQDEHRKSSQRG